MNTGAVWKRWLVVSVLASILATPLSAADPAKEETGQGGGDSVEILLGDQPEEEKKETPARHGSCAWQCERFRKECEVYCKRVGRLPGIESRSRACREDCKQYKMACTRGCAGRAVSR